MTSNEPRISAELFTVPVDGRFLVYAPLRQAAFLTTADGVNAIADLRDGNAESVDAEFVDFLRQLEIVDGGEEFKPVTHFEGDPKPTTVTLFLTTACNLRCTYCYAQAGETPTRAMPLDVAQRGIDFVIRNALELGRPAIEVAYHGGGEPSVNWDTLTGSFEYAKKRTADAGLQLGTALASNGVMPEERIDWIIRHIDGVSLSFDGLPEVHDAHRITVLGHGSSDRVIDTIRRFDDAKYNYGLRLTVTKEFIGRLEESVRYICRRFRPRRIQVEPAYQLGRWRNAPSAETAEFIDQFRAAQATAREYGYEIHFSGARIGSMSNHFCGVTQDSFCLTADGNVSGCYETFLEENEWAKTFIYGSFEETKKEYRFNLPVLENLRKQTVDQREFCQSCYAKWSCGGDCYHKSLTVNGEGEFRGTDRCHIIRELTKDQILFKIAAAGGLFWHEVSGGPVQAQGKEIFK